MSDIGDIPTLLDEYAEAVHIAAKSGALADFDTATVIRAKIDDALAIGDPLTALLWFCDECSVWQRVAKDTNAVADPPETTLRCVVCSHPIAECRAVDSLPDSLR